MQSKTFHLSMDWCLNRGVEAAARKKGSSIAGFILGELGSSLAMLEMLRRPDYKPKSKKIVIGGATMELQFRIQSDMREALARLWRPSWFVSEVLFDSLEVKRELLRMGAMDKAGKKKNPFLKDSNGRYATGKIAWDVPSLEESIEIIKNTK